MDPKTGAWWNLAFIVCTGIAAGSVEFAGFSDYWVKIIRTWATNAAFLISCINLVFHLYASDKSGPLSKEG